MYICMCAVGNTSTKRSGSGRELEVRVEVAHQRIAAGFEVDEEISAKQLARVPVVRYNTKSTNLSKAH